MTLSNEQLDRLEAVLLAAAPGDNPLQALRAGLPGIAVSRCDAEDMGGETPYRRSGGYDVFLVDNRSHCWSIVHDPELAGGIVVAPCRA